MLYLRPKAAAAYGGVSLRQLYKLIAAKLVVARKMGRATLVDMASLTAYLESLPQFQSQAEAQDGRSH